MIDKDGRHSNVRFETTNSLNEIEQRKKYYNNSTFFCNNNDYGNDRDDNHNDKDNDSDNDNDKKSTRFELYAYSVQCCWNFKGLHEARLHDSINKLPLINNP